jgi:hypothetical protein
MTTVVNKYKSEFDVYIGRPSIFGNPFSIGKDGNRAVVIKKYKAYFKTRIAKDSHFKQEVLKLKDKTLGCYCKPQVCHGDIIKEYLDK